MERALGAPRDKLERLERLVAVDYVNSYDAGTGQPERRHERAWRAGLAKMVARVWRDRHEREQYLGEAKPVRPGPRREERQARLLAEYEADAKQAGEERTRAGAQGYPRWFRERWPNGPPSGGIRATQQDPPPGLRAHEQVRQGPGLASLGALLDAAKKGA